MLSLLGALTMSTVEYSQQNTFKKWICWHFHVIGWGTQLLSCVFYKILICRLSSYAESQNFCYEDPTLVTGPSLEIAELNH